MAEVTWVAIGVAVVAVGAAGLVVYAWGWQAGWHEGFRVGREVERAGMPPGWVPRDFGAGHRDD